MLCHGRPPKRCVHTLPVSLCSPNSERIVSQKPYSTLYPVMMNCRSRRCLSQCCTPVLQAVRSRSSDSLSRQAYGRQGTQSSSQAGPTDPQQHPWVTKEASNSSKFPHLKQGSQRRLALCTGWGQGGTSTSSIAAAHLVVLQIVWQGMKGFVQPAALLHRCPPAPGRRVSAGLPRQLMCAGRCCLLCSGLLVLPVLCMTHCHFLDHGRELLPGSSLCP